MATRAKTAAAPAPEGDAPEAAAPAVPHPAITAYQSVWVHKNGVALARNQVGFVTVLKTAAATMIAAGDAVDPNLTMDLPYIEGTKPPPTPPSTVNVSITAISAANPAAATLSANDVTKLTALPATSLAISGATGTDAAQINKSFAFVKVDATHITLTGLDNSAPLSFAGLPLAGVGSKAAAPAEPPAPAPAPAPEPPAPAPAPADNGGGEASA